MKKKFFIFCFPALIMTSSYFAIPCQAQLWKRIKDKVTQTASDHVTNDAGNATDKAIDKTENSAGNAVKGNNNGSNSNQSSNNSSSNSNSSQSSAAEATPTITTYKNYDFVPGDTVIFQSQLADEQVGEIPSQLALYTGQMDIQQINGENVIHIPKGAGVTFSARMTKRNYVPDQFTIEFDYLNEVSPMNHLTIHFGDYYSYTTVDHELSFEGPNVDWTGDEIGLPDAFTRDPMQWHHVAIAVNKNAGKAYIDQFRVININNLLGKVDSIVFYVNGYEDSYIKNIRIAAGGIDIYKEVSTNSKIIMHGILFDVDKATLKPESMGSINKIYSLLKKEVDLKFEIDGHTDNTGDAAHNLTLSQQRADAVKAQLVSMGIDASRLTTKGFGDTKPISDNTTPEGKANNRRVEFVRM